MTMSSPMLCVARAALAVLLASAAAPTAYAQETVDVGVIRDSDKRVVQKLLYPKADRTEIAASVGWMPFDALVTTPNLQLGASLHRNEEFALSAVVGGGYGFKNATYTRLESPTYGVAVDAYRYLASALVGVEMSPAYGKTAIIGRGIIHYDVYGAGRLGATLEQSVIPRGGVAVAPTLSLGIGARFWLSNGNAVRVEIRDDLLIERRKLTQTTAFKQNANILVGYSLMGKKK